MAGIDPSIPLQIQQPPSAMQTISGLLNIQRTQAAIQGQQIQNQSNQANFDEDMRIRDLMKDSTVHNPDGSLNQDAWLQRVQQVAPTRGAPNAITSANASTANTAASRAHFELVGAQAKVGLETAQGALGDPRIMGVMKPDGTMAPPDPTEATTALAERENEMVQRDVPVAKAKMLMAPYYMAAAHNPASLPQLLTNSVKAGIGAQAQLAANTQTYTFIATDKGTQPFGTNANAPGGIGPIGEAMNPPNDIVSTAGGGSAVGNRATKQTTNFDSSGNGPMVDPPPGETMDTQRELQAQRNAVLTLVQNAPTLHNLYGSVRDIASRGLALGTGGEQLQRLASAFGYQMSGDETTDRNMLGKLLARSALTSAQTMAPGTNAGLEASQVANGSTRVDSKTLVQIADLSEANLRGSEAYQQGVEKAIGNPTNKLGVFAKRQYDQDWARNFDPKMMQLVMAKERGDKAEQDSIIKSLEGANSKAAIDFQTRMQAVHRLSTNGGL